MKKFLIYTAVTFAISTSANAINYIHNVKGSFDKEKVQQQVSHAGGQLLDCLPQIGICQVSFESNEQALKSGLTLSPDASAFIPNIETGLTDEQRELTLESFNNPPYSGDDDFYFDLQWGHDAVNAVESWNAGHRGAGVVVAVLDSGADATHPDLAPNINTQLSTSFVAGEAWYDTYGTFNHGSHTAGTIAAADNGYGVIGVAPEAELIILKVLSAQTGSGSSYGTMAGIVYAADNGADVINMSLGLSIRKNGLYDIAGTPYDTSDDIRFAVGGEDGIAAFINSYQKAVDYAVKKGVTIIASAGNDSVISNASDSLVHLPSDLPKVLSISATTPYNWAKDPTNTYLDNRASYSNYGSKSISFAAPGGSVDAAGLPGGFDICQAGVVQHYCFVFDLVFSTSGTGSWYWSAGTSMAAPHAAGVAALIIGKNGGDMDPVHVEKAMRDYADDLGKPGHDHTYGAGRVVAPQ
ncbi:S8 family serine peptidase [Paraferrimonas sp. SM1919]|uniref:S8 family peptidase n=1 Tax=Paraferrimonas sp. SM1919 TaxID=2662263 RepID=UPI0013D49442|nr:S8 family serine peptidase [Paraferrimonas sp. SM1919]